MRRSPLTALSARWRASPRRSLDRTDSGRSAQRRELGFVPETDVDAGGQKVGAGSKAVRLGFLRINLQFDRLANKL